MRERQNGGEGGMKMTRVEDTNVKAIAVILLKLKSLQTEIVATITTKITAATKRKRRRARGD